MIGLRDCLPGGRYQRFRLSQAFHVGLIPTCRLMRFQLELHSMRLRQSGEDPSSPSHSLAAYKMGQSFLTHLLHPYTLQLSLDFVRLEAAWLRSLLLLPPEEARNAFKQVGWWGAIGVVVVVRWREGGIERGWWLGGAFGR